MKRYSKLLLGLIFSTSLMFMSCSDSSDETDNVTSSKERANVYVTDAPIDNANVKAAYVTITDVKIDGKSLKADGNFTAKTVNLLNYQNGDKALLGDLELDSKNYSSLTLVLDYEMDVNGNTPGSYVETVDGTKHKLEAAANEIKISENFEVIANATNNIVVDFDLRKTIKEETGGSSSFNFVTMNELKSGIRVVNEKTTGTIKGMATDASGESDKVIVYAYKKGTFNAETETKGQGESNITFANAVASAVVQSTGSYTLSFLKEGDYELHFASYKDEDNDGKLELNAMLDVESNSNIELDNITVTSESEININVTVTGIL